MVANKKSIVLAHQIYQNNSDLTQPDSYCEIKKFRPKQLKQECERLYDDVLKEKVNSNSLTDENIKLRTRIQFLYEQVMKKERTIQDLINQGS